MTKRVFHPTLNSFEDVPDGDVEKWAAAGWRKTAPKHIDTDEFPEVGSHPGYAQIPVLEDVSSTTTTTSRASSTPTTGGSSAGSTTP